MNKTGGGLSRVMMVATVLAGLGTLGSGCLTRKVSGEPPTTKINYNTVVRQSAIDKIDLLFAIDNSSSMGDKQKLFAEAVPDLITRLLTPDCVDDAGTKVGVVGADGKCATGKPEFEPVNDLHIGIVSSSIGAGGAGPANPLCQPGVAKGFVDDKGHLITRGLSAPDYAKPSNFLSWLPKDPVKYPKNDKKEPIPGSKPETVQAELEKHFREMVEGVSENGCGFEAQLESAYRFLVQPDPYLSIDRPDQVAQLVGVDNELLEQRKNFLRPDSLVAIIMLTDENESTVDPLALGANAWRYEDATTQVKRGTPECSEPAGPNTGPNNPNCFSCFQTNATGKPGCADRLPPAEDLPNVRFFHMKQRFGVDPRYPIERYVNGFSQPRVPNRDGEHPNGSFSYVGNPNCTNPLFAKNLPANDQGGAQSLCELPKGPRSPDLIFFALIGGVPWQLLTTDPQGGNGPFKDTLESGDWQKILGVDPLRYDFTGQDPRMTESIKSRGLPGDWETDNNDLQYACTFDLPARLQRDCSAVSTDEYCDCKTGSKTPLCQGTKQIKGKAYPTINELAVTKALDKQGIVGSLCPRTLDEASPDYGYRPAVRTIVNRLKNALNARCIPQPLEEEADGTVPCLILELLPDSGDQATACDPGRGLEQPDPGVLRRYREQQQKEGATPDELKLPLCAIKQLKGGELVDNSCENAPGAGWCYVTRKNRPTEECAQSIRFSPSGNPPSGAVVNLQCIEQPPSIGAPDGG